MVRELSAAHAAATYDDALRVLEAHGAELVAVVTDLQLGEPRTGLNLLQEVEARWPHVARILVSASLDRVDAKHWERFDGPQRVFPKPWRPGELVDAVLALADAPIAHEFEQLERTTEFPAAEVPEQDRESRPPITRQMTPKG